MNGVAFIVSDNNVGHILFDNIRKESVREFLKAFSLASDVSSDRKTMVLLSARHKTYFMTLPVAELMRESVLYSTSIWR